MNINVKLLLICVLLSACGYSDDESRVEVLLPYFSECTDTVRKVKHFLESSSSDKNYTLGLDIEEFNVTPYSHPEMVGVARLFSIGNWSTLDGGTPKEYLVLEANSIKADCMPNNVIDINLNGIGDLGYIERKTKEKSSNYLRYVNGKLILYFNDGHYQVNDYASSGDRSSGDSVLNSN